MPSLNSSQMKSNLSPPLFSEAPSVGSPPAIYDIGGKAGYEFPKPKQAGSSKKRQATNMTLPGYGVGRIKIEQMNESQFGPSRAGVTEGV